MFLDSLVDCEFILMYSRKYYILILHGVVYCRFHEISS